MKALNVGIVLAIFATMATTEETDLSRLERSSSMNCFLLCINNKILPNNSDSALTLTASICVDLCAIERKDYAFVQKYVNHLRKFKEENFNIGIGKRRQQQMLF